MKLKDGFILGEIAGECVVLPSGNNLDLSKMTTLNATGKFIWERLEKETTEDVPGRHGPLKSYVNHF